MTLAELISQFRTDSQDNRAPYLSSDDNVTLWLNEAQEDAAVRANLIFDADTDAVCQIAVVAGTASYSLHTSIFRVTRAAFTPTGSTQDPIELVLTDRKEQDRTRPGWRYLTEEPRHVIVDDTKISFACLPDTSGTLDLEVYRAPLVAMAAAVVGPPAVAAVGPEIARAHHRFLPLWALHRHFSQPDAEVHDPGRAEKAEKAFTRQFGERPDADLRKSFEANTPHHNKAYF